MRSETAEFGISEAFNARGPCASTFPPPPTGLTRRPARFAGHSAAEERPVQAKPANDLASEAFLTRACGQLARRAPPRAPHRTADHKQTAVLGLLAALGAKSEGPTYGTKRPSETGGFYVGYGPPRLSGNGQKHTRAQRS